MSEHELDDYADDELPALPCELAAAVDDLLEELEDPHRLEDAAVRELLWRVLERIGRLEQFCSVVLAGFAGRPGENAMILRA